MARVTALIRLRQSKANLIFSIDSNARFIDMEMSATEISLN